jgi:hypothetical protein
MWAQKRIWTMQTARVLLPNGKLSKSYSKPELQRLFSGGKVPDGSKLLLEADLEGWLRDDAPTEKQLAYATSLGVTIPEGVTKAKLSALIGIAKSEQVVDEAERWKQEDTIRDMKQAAIDEAIEYGGLVPVEDADLAQLLERATNLEDAPDNCGAVLLRYDLADYEDAALWHLEGCDPEEAPTFSSLQIDACDMTDGGDFKHFIRAFAMRLS